MRWLCIQRAWSATLFFAGIIACSGAGFAQELPLVAGSVSAARARPPHGVRSLYRRSVPLSAVAGEAVAGVPWVGEVGASDHSSPDGRILPGLPSALIAVIENSGVRAESKVAVRGAAGNEAGQSVAALGSAAVADGPVALRAAIWTSDDAALSGLFLPFEVGTGAAAFVRGDDVIVAFDVARPLDLSNVRDRSIFGAASVRLLPEATIVKLPNAAGGGLAVRRVGGGWLINSHAIDRAGKAIVPMMDGSALRLPVHDPGRVIMLPDPLTGGNLLVGTLRSGQDETQIGRRGNAEMILTTLLGVVVVPLSDRLELRPSKDAFVLVGTEPGLLDLARVGSGGEARTDPAFPRIMSLPDRPLAVLLGRFAAAEAAAAVAPAESRFLPRIKAAEDALSLDDPAQAETIARVALADDARNTGALLPRLVLAAAQLLGHRPVTGNLLETAQATSNSELALWRGVKLAQADPASPEAARLFAASLSVLQSYPAPLRSALMPVVEETLVRGGSDGQASMIEQLARSDQDAFARGLLAERRRQKQAALVIFDKLAMNRDLRVADKAAEEAVGIRDVAGQVDKGKLAAILEAHLLDARIGGHELPSRLRLADAWVSAGEWEKALDLLRETATLYPDRVGDVRHRVGAVLRRMSDAVAMPVGRVALEQAAMIEGNADLLPDGADGRAITLFLADRLSQLDLAERAAPVVQKMMRSTAPGADRGELGLRLANLDLQLSDLAGVQAALGESDAPDLSPDLVARRLLVMARGLAGAGELDQAVSALAPSENGPALDFKASLMARQGDWRGATDTLLSLARLEAPTPDLLLRLASAASRSRDKARIDAVRDLGRGRFKEPGKAALFQLLTSDPEGDGSRPMELPRISDLHDVSAAVNAISD